MSNNPTKMPCTYKQKVNTLDSAKFVWDEYNTAMKRSATLFIELRN